MKRVVLSGWAEVNINEDNDTIDVEAFDMDIVAGDWRPPEYRSGKSALVRARIVIEPYAALDGEMESAP